MKTLLSLLLCFTFGFNSCAFAAALDQTGDVHYPKTTVIVFLDKFFLTSEKAVSTLKTTLSSKFKDASIVCYGDNQSKSPEFLEFSEKVQSDPVNEKRIRVLPGEYVLKYAQDTSSDYIVLFTMQEYYNYITQGGDYYDMKQEISIFDVSSKKWVEDVAWRLENQKYAGVATEKFMKKLNTEFNWTPTAYLANKQKQVQQPETKKLSVVVFVPDLILSKPEAVEIIRKAVAEKFKISDVPIYLDDKPKTQEFLYLANKVGVDSAKQKTFLLKKENLVEYGKVTNSDLVVAINFSLMSYSFNGFDFAKSIRLKEDIYVVDVASNKYIINTVFDTNDTMNRVNSAAYLTEKLKTDFNIPVN